jgi:outer membrane assembly lipoprotein YfiO
MNEGIQRNARSPALPKPTGGLRIALFALFALLALFAASCGGYPDDIDIDQGLNETDRNLFERARFDMQRGEHARARLLLQTLRATYSDSEFVPDAMYAMAETWYHMGTRADLAQADYEFSNFRVFFPTHELADDAQMMRAMGHIRQMEKSDRDQTESLLAERELQTLISQYPDSDLAEEARVKLRAVQDVIAEGSMRIGNHYYTVGAFAAAAARFQSVLDDYPDFSGTSEVLYRLGEIHRRAGNPGEAIVYYSRVVRDHPESSFDRVSRARLTDLGQPLPEVNPAALAQLEARPDPVPRSLASRMFGVFSSRPAISTETTAASILEENPQGSEPGDGEFSVDGVILEVGDPPSAPSSGP